MEYANGDLISFIVVKSVEIFGSSGWKVASRRFPKDFREKYFWNSSKINSMVKGCRKCAGGVETVTLLKGQVI